MGKGKDLTGDSNLGLTEVGGEPGGYDPIRLLRMVESSELRDFSGDSSVACTAGSWIVIEIGRV